ncbi:hypothetical protein [Polaribacter sp. R77954]|uniref:hypothetical protein n=1 Tax=Polaribacter sp. R77954 TaxID=3093870 RepID=UPI0037C8DC03
MKNKFVLTLLLIFTINFSFSQSKLVKEGIEGVLSLFQKSAKKEVYKSMDYNMFKSSFKQDDVYQVYKKNPLYKYVNLDDLLDLAYMKARNVGNYNNFYKKIIEKNVKTVKQREIERRLQAQRNAMFWSLESKVYAREKKICVIESHYKKLKYYDLYNKKLLTSDEIGNLARDRKAYQKYNENFYSDGEMSYRDRLYKVRDIEKELLSDLNFLNQNPKKIKKIDDLIQDFEKRNTDIENLKTYIDEEKTKIKKKFELIGEGDNNTSIEDILLNFQKKYDDIQLTKKFDNATSNKIDKIEEEFKNKLNKTIADSSDKTIEEQIKIFKEVNNLKNNTIIIDKELKSFLDSNNNTIVFVDGKYQNFANSNVGIKNTSGVEIKKLNTIQFKENYNLHILKEDNLGNTLDELNKNLDWDYNLNEIAILPLTKNNETLNLFKNSPKQSWIKSKLRSEKEIARKIKRNKRKTVITVGHIEDGFYVEGDFKIALTKLNEIAKANKVNIFHLGCSTAALGDGTATAINTYKTVNALIPSIKNNKNFKNFLLDFSTKKIGPNNTAVDLVLSADTFSNKGFAKMVMYQKAAAGTATLGGGLLIYYIINNKN